MKIILDDATCHVARYAPPGSPARHDIVLVHGAANDHSAWHDVAPLLASRGATVHVPDLPGHGQSTGKPLDSVEALAGWLLALVAALGLEAPIFAGHSMGSLIALAAAAKAGQGAGGLALLGSAVPMPVSEALLDSARKTPDAACRMVALWSHTPAFFLGGGGGHGVWGPGRTLAVMRRNAGTLATDLDNCNRYRDGLSAAASVVCPTLLLLARRDRMTPLRSAQALQEALKNPVRREIADCGHAMMVEKPAEVAEALASFIVGER